MSSDSVSVPTQDQIGSRENLARAIGRMENFMTRVARPLPRAVEEDLLVLITSARDLEQAQSSLRAVEQERDALRRLPGDGRQAVLDRASLDRVLTFAREECYSDEQIVVDGARKYVDGLIAALRSSEERVKALTEALRNIDKAALALLDPADWRDGDVQTYPAAKAHAIRGIVLTALAASPSSSPDNSPEIPESPTDEEPFEHTDMCMAARRVVDCICGVEFAPRDPGGVSSPAIVFDKERGTYVLRARARFMSCRSA